MGSFVQPFNSPFGAGKPEALPLSSLGGKPAVGPGRRGRSKAAGGGGPSSIFDFNFYTGPTAFNDVTVVIDTTAALQRLWYDTDIGRDYTTATGQEYAELSVDSASAQELEQFYFGFNDDAQTARQDSPLLLGIEKDSSAGTWYACYGSSVYTHATINNMPHQNLTAGDIIGVAWDWDAGKVYMHMNGTWLTDAAANGGEPGTGPGWTITGTTNAMRLALGARVFNVGGTSTTVIAVAPTNKPAGYTSLT